MANGYNIDINFNGAGGSPGATGTGGSSSNYLGQVLSKLTTAVDKLVNVLNKQNFNLNNGAIPGGGSGSTPANSNYFSDEKAASIFTQGTIAAIAITTVRWMSANANSLMAQAGNRGAFAAAGILGNSNQAFGSYVGNYYDIQLRKRLAVASAIGESGGAFVGGAVGLGAGALTGNGLVALKSAGVGASIGGGAGDYAVARLYGANLEQSSLINKAWAEREANASTSEWQTGFTRFGLARTNQVIAGGGLTGGDPISVQLSQAFEKKYGTVNGAFNPNYNAILNGIVPYLQTNPLSSKSGNLNDVAQNFQQAGFAVSQFGALTMQASQYQALTGKNLQQFSVDLKTARSKFGDVYDLGSNQTALTLMSMGYSPGEAQNIAFQSKYNSGILGSTAQFTSMNPTSYYSSLALGKPLGFDLFNTIKTGQFQGSNSQRKSLLEQVKQAESGAGLSPELMILESQGYSIGQVGQWLQPKVSSLKGAVTAKTSFSDAQSQAMKELTDGVKNALNNVGEMVVNATNVHIYNANSSTLQSNITNAMGPYIIKGQDRAARFAMTPFAKKIGGILPIKK